MDRPLALIRARPWIENATHATDSFIVELTTGEYVHGLFDVPIHPD
jgi:hypothetical protein